MKDPIPQTAAPGDAAFDDLDADGELETLLAESMEVLQLSAAEYFAALTESASELAGQAREVVEAGQDYVRTHPGGIVLGALAVGVAVGWLLGRR